MANYKSNDNSTLSTKLREWWTIVRLEFTRVFDILNGHFNGAADRHKAADIDTENGVTVETALLQAQEDIAANETAITALDTRLATVENEVMPVKSVVSETLTSTYYVLDSNGYYQIVASKNYTIPDGFKCTTIKVNITTNLASIGENCWVTFFNQDPDAATSSPVISSFALSEGENIITDIPDECKVFCISAEKNGSDISSTDNYTIDIEITYEGASKLDEKFAAIETELDTKADKEYVDDAISAVNESVSVTRQTLDVPASGYVTYNTTFDYDELTSLKVSAESNIYVTVGKKGSGLTDWMLWGDTTLITEIDIVPECKNQIDIGDPTVADGDEITVYIYSRDGVEKTATVEETRVNKLTDRVAALESSVGDISAVLDAINGEVV